MSLSIGECELLTKKLEQEWKIREQGRISQAHSNRINKPGQGRPYELGTFFNLLLATILYMRTSMGYELLGLLLGVDKTTVKRIVSRVIPLLQDRFIPKTHITKRKRRTNDLDELLKDYPELEDVLMDATELSIKRPKKRQKQSYSGKKKKHTKKITIATNKKDNLIIGVSPPAKGRMHDKKQLEHTGWDTKLPDTIKRMGDLGYQGMPKDTWNIPHKKPKNQTLTRSQKRANTKLSKERIAVEHSIRGVKIFRRIGETITLKTDQSLTTTFLAAVNLYNFKRLVRQGI